MCVAESEGEFGVYNGSQIIRPTKKNQLYLTHITIIRCCDIFTMLTPASFQFRIKHECVLFIIRYSIQFMFGKCDFHCHKYESTALNRCTVRTVAVFWSRKANIPLSPSWCYLIESITSLPCTLLFLYPALLFKWAKSKPTSLFCITSNDKCTQNNFPLMFYCLTHVLLSLLWLNLLFWMAMIYSITISSVLRKISWLKTICSILTHSTQRSNEMHWSNF